jgi:hypothetical protein
MLPWFSTVALAHGPPAAVLDVASWDDDGPVHVVLTEGLALREGPDWRYVCPTRWGGLPLAPFAAGTPAAVWLPGLDDLYRVDSAGAVAPVDDPRHAVTDLLDLDGHDGVWGIYVAPAGREIAHLDSGFAIDGGPVSWSGVLGRPGGADLVAASEGRLLLGALDENTGDIDAVAGPPLVGTGPQLVSDGASEWAIDRASGYVGVHALPDGALVAQATAAVEGPLRVGDATFVALDGLLFTLGPDGPVRAPADGIGCLTAGGDHRWACARDLYALAADGWLGERILPLDELLSPDLGDLSRDDAVDCWGEWRIFALDLGIDPGAMPAAAAAPGPVLANGTCASPLGRIASTPALLCLALAFCARAQNRRVSG